MPKLRPGMPKPPKGFDKIASGLDEYDAAMKDALAEPIDGKRKSQLQWGVSRVNTQRTRFVFNALRAGDIDAKVAEYCVQNGFADGSLMKLWAVPGYETACCTNCVDSRQSTFGGTCVCRVPIKDRVSAGGPCARCGCNGCCSADVAAQRQKETEERQRALQAMQPEEQEAGPKKEQKQQQDDDEEAA